MQLRIRGAYAGGRRLAEQRQLQLADYGARDVVLDLEHILEVAVVRLRPEVIAVVGAHQLCRDAHGVTHLADAPFQHVRHLERLPDLADRDRAAAERERGGPGRDAQVGNLRQQIDQLLGRKSPELLPLGIDGYPPARSSCRSALVFAPARVGPKASKPISDWRRVAPKVPPESPAGLA